MASAFFSLQGNGFPRLHKSALESIPGQRSHSDLITFVKNHL
jgi:hypothetical protein